MKKCTLILMLIISFKTITAQTLLTSMPDTDDDVKAIVRSGNIVVVGGIFTTLGTFSRPFLAAFDANTGTVLPWNPMPDDEINCLMVAENKLFVGGNFSTISGQTRKGLAVYDLPGLNLISFGPSPAGFGGVYDLKYRNGKIYYNDYNQNWGLIIKRFDGLTGVVDSWQTDPMDLGMNVNFDVLGNYIYVGGFFDAINNQYIYDGLAQFDLTTGAVDNINIYNFSSNSFIKDVESHNGKIYIAGSYTTIDGLSRKGACEIDINGNITPLDFHTSSSQNYALFAQGNTMWMGGNSSYLGAGSSYRMAQIKLSDGYATCWNINATLSSSVWVNALFVTGDTVYAATEGPGTLVRNLNVFVGNPSYTTLGPDISIAPGGSAVLTASGNFQNYLWNTGATTSSIIINTPGVYWVTASIPGGCIGTDTIVVTLATGMEELNESGRAFLYPNPVHNNVKVSCDQCPEEIKITILDALGRTCMESMLRKGEMELLVGKLPAGIYQVVISDLQARILHTMRMMKEAE